MLHLHLMVFDDLAESSLPVLKKAVEQPCIGLSAPKFSKQFRISSALQLTLKSRAPYGSGVKNKTSGFPLGLQHCFLTCILCWFHCITIRCNSSCRRSIKQYLKQSICKRSPSLKRFASRKSLKNVIHQSAACRRKMLHQASIR